MPQVRTVNYSKTPRPLVMPTEEEWEHLLDVETFNTILRAWRPKVECCSH